MARYFWTAEDYALDAVPSDSFSSVLNVSAFAIKSDGAGGKYLEITSTSNGDTRMRFTPPGTSVTDCQVWMKFVTQTGEEESCAHARGANLTSSSTYSHVRIDSRQASGSAWDRLVQASSGTFTSLETKTLTTPFDTIGEMLMDVNSTTLRGKWWNTSGSEPAEWGLTQTVTVTDAGEIGPDFGAPAAGSKMYVYAFGVGTDGDTAPQSAGEPRKITVTDLKAPNDANTTIADATGVQVKLWISNDSNDPTDTGAPDVLSTTATITSGTMEVNFSTLANVGNPVLGVAKWTDLTDDYFFPIETTVQEVV